MSTVLPSLFVHERAMVTLSAAQQIIGETLERAHAEGNGAIACSVVGGSGEPIAFAAHDDCSPLARTLAERKAVTAAMLRRTTAEVRAASESGTLSLAQIGDRRFVTMLGGAPLVVDGVVVGAIGVSGLPPEQDMQLAQGAALNFAQSQHRDLPRAEARTDCAN